MLKLFYSYDVPVLSYDCLNISLNFVLKLVTRSLSHLSTAELNVMHGRLWVIKRELNKWRAEEFFFLLHGLCLES